ncbi:hypothetical protein GCM10008014_20240 [Paenibacillus silvae]|uniref:Uncharacterized protein n=1 Tax=Paenibacillus silvae TaxID=1325358 RepID=A0ABQ1Z8N5_9BACL|nr:hypothetical protein GCM10008014_20240 [Paenibacillus silvae]
MFVDGKYKFDFGSEPQTNQGTQKTQSGQGSGIVRYKQNNAWSD